MCRRSEGRNIARMRSGEASAARTSKLLPGKGLLYGAGYVGTAKQSEPYRPVRRSSIFVSVTGSH